MKKITFVFAVVALALSCQKEMAPASAPEASSSIKATAAAMPGVKVSFEQDNVTHNLLGSWEVNDTIFGFKDGGEAFDFVVTAVDPATGVATLNQLTNLTFSEGDLLHAIYHPGSTSADLEAGSFSVDFSEQTEDVIPVLMLCDATVTAGPSVSFSFSNAAAIVGVENPVLPTAMSTGKQVRNVTLSGHGIVSSGKVAVNAGTLAFTADAPSNFVKKTVRIGGVAGEGSTYTINTPVYVVTPAGGVIDKISVYDNKGNYYEYTLGKTPQASKYYRIAGKTFPRIDLPEASGVVVGGVNWAKCNLGTNSVANMGDLYRWSEYGPTICTEHSSSTGKFIVGYETGFTARVGELYCLTTGSKPTYSKYSGSDGLTVLQPVDDRVQLLYPGTNWRMPTAEEFTALKNISTDEYTITYDPDDKKGVKYILKADTSVALFLRSNTWVGKNSGTTMESKARFWSSTISSDETNKTYTSQYFACTYSTSTKTTSGVSMGVAQRYCGYSIRPVKPAL